MNHSYLPEARDEMESVEVNIADAKKAVAHMEAIARLQNNKDFNLVINEGYLKDEAVRLVHLKNDFNMASEEQQRFIENAIIGIGQFRSYLGALYRQGNMAKQALEDHENTREEMLREEMTGE